MERQAYLRPSSAALWSKCKGYAALNAALGTEFVEESDNEVREDGTACHWLAEQVWNGNRPSVGSLSPNGREVTDEMYSAVAEYHAMIRSWGCQVLLEQQVPVSHYFPGVADGTPDAHGYDMVTGVLDVGDLKYGYRPVEAWRNAQMIVYAWTIVCQLTKEGHAPQRVRLHICQPRCAHRDGTVRTWVVGIPELAELAATLAQAAQDCYAPNPPCTVNPGCRNCVAAYGCRTLQAASLDAIEVSYDATPFLLNDVQLGYELSKLMQAQKHIEHRITGLSTQAESLIRKGTSIPGFELGRAATRYRWRDEALPLMVRIGELFGVKVMDEPKLKSVAKLRDSLPAEIVAMYAVKPTGELRLRLTDPNEAIKRFTGQ